MLIVSVLQACSDSIPYEDDADIFGHTSPTLATEKANKRYETTLPLLDKRDFNDARRGFIAQEQGLKILNSEDEKIWDISSYDFVNGVETNYFPSSVHPSLWRQAFLNNIHGLFEVTKGIYQLRGFDLANMTIIEGEQSWIIVDPLTTSETAKKAFNFAKLHLKAKPVSAILFTHSHIDHFGGVQGILDELSQDEMKRLRIIAPQGFMEEATSENIIAAGSMSRRSMYMYGKRLTHSERGHIDSGLGKEPAFGSFSITAPTELITKTPTHLSIDGVPFVFQYVPGSEAPAEFTFYLPNHKAFCGAELVSRNMHNLYTLRGAKVRDALVWSNFIDQANHLFSDADVYFGSHHWPLWGNENVRDFLTKQSDTYKYIHDQSVRLMNAGHTPNEIAEQIELPASLASNFFNRGYYGTLKHNAKAVYQFYMGWFTGNPASLDPLPEAETASRTIHLMGGVDVVLDKANKLFTDSSNLPSHSVTKEYRWIAQLLNMVVFTDPGNTGARSLLAKTYDQLGYQAESAPWRDFYLTGAYELRHGGPDEGISPGIMKSILLNTPVEKFFDSMAVNLNGVKAEGKKINIEIQFTDLDKRYLLILKNSVLRHRELKKDDGELKESAHEPDTILKLTYPLFIDALIGEAGFSDLLLNDELNVSGSKIDLIALLSLMEKQQGVFNIVTP